MAGSLLGVNQHLELRGLPLKAASLPLGRSSLLENGAAPLSPGWSPQVRTVPLNTIR